MGGIITISSIKTELPKPFGVHNLERISSDVAQGNTGCNVCHGGFWICFGSIALYHFVYNIWNENVSFVALNVGIISFYYHFTGACTEEFALNFRGDTELGLSTMMNLLELWQLLEKD